MDDTLEATLEVQTPEQVVISLPLGGVGSRMAAYGWDFAIRLALSALIAIPAIFVAANWPGLGAVAAVGALVGWLLLHFGYYVYHEVLHAGQTPGKRRMGLRTIRADGTPVDLTASLLRNLVRMLDWLPAVYGVGIVSIFVSPHEQRLGDIVAGTVVIMDEPQFEKHTLVPDEEEYEQICSELGILHPARIQMQLSEGLSESLRRFFQRTASLDPDRQDELSRRLADEIRRHTRDPEEELIPHLDDDETRLNALRFALWQDQRGEGNESI